MARWKRRCCLPFWRGLNHVLSRITHPCCQQSNTDAWTSQYSVSCQDSPVNNRRSQFVGYLCVIPIIIYTTLVTLKTCVQNSPTHMRTLWTIIMYRTIHLTKASFKAFIWIFTSLHPKNLRQISIKSVLRKIGNSVSMTRQACSWRNVKASCSLQSTTQLIRKFNVNCCLRFLKRTIILLVCTLCCLVGLTALLLQEAQTRGLKDYLLHQDFRGRHFQPPMPMVRRVIIVEEHHEVLKYWYEAALDNIIPKEGITLFHFDSHSGLSPPDHVTEDFPLFHWPDKLNQLHEMMQESDSYVMNALFAKLIKRYIWVWPSWNIQNFPKDSEYLAYVLFIGWTKQRTPDGKADFKEICGCLVNDKFNECRIRNTTNPKLSSKENVISREQCNIEHKVIVEIVRDDIAQDKLETEVDWLKPDEPIILDVDADFYGVGHPGNELIAVGLSNGMTRNISEAVSKIICPRSTRQEMSADKIMVKIIDAVQRYRFCRFQRCSERTNFLALIKYVDTLLLDAKADPDLYGMFCKHSPRRHQAYLDEMVKLFIKLTTSQLFKIRSIGFCFRTSPKSRDFSQQRSFVLCTGKSYNDIPEVGLFSPSKQAVMNRTALLQEILYDGVISPKLVTISRSVREGYAPREHINLIENHLLATVHQVVNKNTTEVHFDKDLLGGVFGWQNRNKDLNADRQIWESELET